MRIDMKFEDSFFSSEKRYSLGQELESGKYYVSIPVSNTKADYEEYYEVSMEFHNAFPSNTKEVEEFVEACRLRQKDSLLLVKPGSDRGYP
jgi:hypothetical protein